MSLFIGLSALQSSQLGLDIISQNIANANTLGYHRQSVHFESRNDNLFRNRRIGSGVAVNDIERIRLQVVESFLTETVSDAQRIGQQLSIETGLETLFLPGEGSLQNSLDSLFNDIDALARQPSDLTFRSQVVQSGSQLASQFRELTQRLVGLQDSARQQLEFEVSQLNREIVELNNLNQQIVTATAAGGPPNGLLDQRDVLINSIAEKINISRRDLDGGVVNLTFGNYSISSSVVDIEFQVHEDENGVLSVRFGEGERTLQLHSGRVTALLEGYNSIVPEYEAKLDELAGRLIRDFDQIHATGVGVNGPFSQLVGARGVEFLNVPLNSAGASFPIEAGELYFSITDPSGQRQTASITFDPAVDSLSDVAGYINSIPNISATVDPHSNQLQINAASGYHFDFTGSIANIPTFGTWTGTSEPTIGGVYTGDDTTEFTARVVGSGTVGVSEDLTLEITDSDGTVVRTVNIGHGYEAAQPIEVVDGIELTVPPGTVADGDTFSVTAVANSDETGVLSALGLNSFFAGDDANSIAVAQRIIDDPGLFSSSLEGDSASTERIDQFGALKRATLLGDARQTFSDYINDLTAEIGVRVQTSQRLSINLETVRNQYQRERDSVSGVDVNEEFVRLTQYQRSYEAAVRVIQTAESVFDELFAILR